jgi:predicted DCC family thiol-disulfide oxidoreductase YuxK
MNRLYVLYDANCGLCSWAKRWLLRQPTLIELRFIPVGSALAARLFPGLDPIPFNES